MAARSCRITVAVTLTPQPSASRAPLAADFGDVPTWLGSIGTDLGLIAAVVAAFFVYRQLAELRRQNEIQQEASNRQAAELENVRDAQQKQLELLELEISDRRAAQARQVTVSRNVRAWGSEQGIENGFTLALTVTNNSRAPITNLTAKYASQPEAGDGEEARYGYRLTDGNLAPTANGGITDGWLHKIRFVPPMQMLEQGEAVMLTAAVRADAGARLIRGMVRFTDADGRHWQVNQDGVLGELRDGRDW